MAAVNAMDALVDAVADRVLERIGAAERATAKKRLLTYTEAGQYMGGKKPDAIRKMVEKGVIPAAAVKRMSARRIFLDIVELDKWIAAQ